MNDEAVFLESIRTDPDDDTARLVYADWLDERGDSRGEWLRVEVELRANPPGVRLWELRRRLQDLSRRIDEEWIAATARTTVVTCREWGTQSERCGKQWSQLRLTDQRTVRMCQLCHQPVFYCRDLDEVRFHVEREQCVAVTPDVDRWVVDDMIRTDWGRGAHHWSFTPSSPDPTPLPPAIQARCEDKTERAKSWLAQYRIEPQDTSTSAAADRKNYDAGQG